MAMRACRGGALKQWPGGEGKEGRFDFCRGHPMWSDGVQILEVGGVVSDEGGSAPIIRTPPPCFAPEVFLEPGPLR